MWKWKWVVQVTKNDQNAILLKYVNGNFFSLVTLVSSIKKL